MTKEPITSKALKKLDEGILYCVNRAVHAWNWTTGRTRADLANLLQTGGVIAGSLGMILSMAIDKRYFESFVYPLILFGGAHFVQRKNMEIDGLELKALEKEAKSIEVEEFKYNCKFGGYFTPPLAVIPLLSNGKELDWGHLYGVMCLSLGVAFQVMRADYFPPRKNVLARAKDKLAEMLRAYQRKPALEGAL